MKVYTNRPYTICHILSSADGRISGNLFSASETMTAQSFYSDIRREYNCPAVLNGTVTSAQIYADGYIDSLPKADRHYPREDFAADTSLQNFVVCLDTEGTLKWSGNTLERGGQKNHVIEILTEKVSDDYIAYLRKQNISYIFAGEEEFDASAAMQKLKKMFHINTLMITGGGIIDWTLLQAGMLDEVSLVISPVISGEREAATSFDQSPFVSGDHAIGLQLTNTKTFPDGTIWLNYKAKNAKQN